MDRVLQVPPGPVRTDLDTVPEGVHCVAALISGNLGDHLGDAALSSMQVQRPAAQLTHQSLKEKVHRV